jgi:hypothetical protein
MPQPSWEIIGDGIVSIDVRLRRMDEKLRAICLNVRETVPSSPFGSPPSCP